MDHACDNIYVVTPHISIFNKLSIGKPVCLSILTTIQIISIHTKFFYTRPDTNLDTVRIKVIEKEITILYL